MKTILFTILLLPAIASAHAMLDHADPAVGSEVSTVPTTVTLYFDESIDAATSAIEVTDAAGHRIDKADAHGDKRDPNKVAISIAGAAGKVKVAWKAKSVGDGHQTHGDFTFTVKP